jgi:PAS domain S-box-containing protein
VTELSGYAFSPLREGDIALHRGSGNGLAPILLVATEETSLGCVERLEHEYALKAELDADWAARPVALTHYNDRMTLVLEDPGGVPVDRLLGRPLDVSHFLRIGIPLAGALRKVHERGLIHKDIKPANILVDAASGGVWLTGFGNASRLPREHQSPAPPEVIAGTLAYMAPEQTGRMNRSVDSRSDLYALGVTFYEMLTGGLPFTAADPMEWVHCHIARQPVPLDERVAGIQRPLAAIVMKLLAKTAEQRYQTAAGVEADFQRCLAEWESHGRIDPFPLGDHDVSDRLLIPEKLYGRERENDALLASFDRVVADGTLELVLVSGYSGIGKSSVVNELRRALVPSRGLFASGKFDQYKRDIPYTTLGQAFQSLVRSLLSKSEAELGGWRDSLREALGPNGQLIVNLVPELEFVIGKQPPVPDLPPRDAQNRFQSVFRRFLGAFATREHPLALFLDDLQWLDAATLDLLEHLVTHWEVRHLLLVGAYRDNEVSPSHPLVRTLEAIRKAGARVQEIVLAPLGLDDVGQLIADALHCEPERARPLAELVQEKTGGNPFFAIQFFIALADEGLLAFDPVTRAWQWNIDRIRAKSYTDNVVELMEGKLRRLSAPTQDALKQLACLGNVADIATLALVNGETEEAIHAALWEAVHAGLVFHQERAYKFLHDRIQQAAYSLIPELQRVEVHLRIGRALLASMTADELAEHLFDVSNQLNRGAARLVDRDEKTQVSTIDLRAGRKAKASAAYASANVYLAAGKARFLSGDYDEALAAADKATALLWTSTGRVQLLEYFYYTALTAAALYENATADEQNRWRELLTAHLEQLREWADNYPPTFADKHALVSAEIARLEGRDLDAMHLYEQAIRSARDHGFVQNEALSHELAARFCAARGFDTIAHAYLREARRCYLRWGATGKVRQLEQLHPHLRDASVPASPNTTIGAHVEQLDVGTVLKASQAVSGEIVLGELIKTLLRIAIEHAGAGRGLLVLFPDDAPRIVAEATTGGGQVEVTLRETAMSPAALPESVLHTVIRTRESVILDDALAQNPFSADKYICQKHARSVLCLPLVKQAKLIGVLYLENNLASHVFTPARISVLELLASQAAISLENARLYNDLQEREAKIRRLVDSNIIGIIMWDFEGRILDANEAFLHMVGYSRDDLVSGVLRWSALTPAEWNDAQERAAAEVRATGSHKPFEKEYLRKDGSRVPVLLGGAAFDERRDQGVSFVLDLTDRKRVEGALRDAQTNLAHVVRITTLGELTASIAHEVNQPLAAVVSNAEACLRWLGRGTPDLDEARNSVECIINDGNRASEVIRRVRALANKADIEKAPLGINDVVREVVALVQGQLVSHQVSLRLELASALPMILGDRVQLQQVMINLMMNGMEAMQSITDRPRELVIRSLQDETQQVLVSVADCGGGISAENADRLFNAFFTTKSSGMGMGLSICRSVMEAHSGRLWATANVPHGATFQFTLPVNADTAS